MDKNDMDRVPEQDLINALMRRGWRFKETRIPVQIPGPKGGPTYLARQLQHSGEPEASTG